MNSRFKLSFLYLVVLAVQSAIYQFTGWLNEMHFQKVRIVDVKMVVDDWIFFSEFAVWPYSLYYILLIAPLILCRNEKIFFPFLKSFIFVSIIADIMFLLVPISGPRISVQSIGESISSVVLMGLYQIDRNTNCFPSLHSAHSLLIAYFLRLYYGAKSLIPIFFQVAAILVIISTLVTKQHWFSDIVMAVIISVMALRIYGKELSNQ